jgi:hypothetical protein
MPKLPEEHIGNIPAGHKRDEENRRRTDALEQQREEEEKAFGGAIDPSKMRHIDNEVAQGFERHQRRRRSGMPPLSNPRPGFVYGWFPNEDFFRTSEARVVVRSILDTARQEGYFPVTDEHSPDTGADFKQPAGGDTLRRWGDTVLWAINKADYQLLMLENERRKQRQGAVEENYVNTSQRALGGRGLAYDQTSPRFEQKMGHDKTQPFTATVAPEGEQRR